MSYGRKSFPTGLLLIVTVLAVGWGRIGDFASRIGLIPSASAADVEAAYAKQFSRPNRPTTARCRKGTDGWDFICDVEYDRDSRTHVREVAAIASTWMTPLATIRTFPPNQPVPARVRR